MKKGQKKTVILVAFIIIFVVIAFFASLYYITSTVNNYSYSEKSWISNNTDTSFDVYIPSSLPIFSSNGSGVFYNYLNALKSDTGLTFNVLTTDTTAIKLTNKMDIDSNDLVFYKDHYIVVSTGEALNKLTDLSYKTVGVMKDTLDTVSYYLTDYAGIKYESYETFDAMETDYTEKKIDYIIVPCYKYINKIIEDDLGIVYHLDGLYSYYTLTLDSTNTELSSIMTKFYYRWKDKASKEISEFFLDIYYEAKNYTELEKESITNDDFIVGYISNLPFEGMIRSTFTGLTSTYLSKFSDITGVTYKYIKYEDTKALNDSLKNKNVDIVLNYYSLSNDNYNSSRILGTTDYVVLAHTDNNAVINSLYSLVNSNVVMLSNMNLKYNMSSKNLFEIKDYATVKAMSKNINEDSIIIVEKEVYDYYKDSYFKNYSIRYMNSVRLNNSFLLNKNNEAFNKLFDFYLSTLSSNEVKNESVEGVISTLKNNRVFNFIMTNLFYIVVSMLVIGFITYGILSRVTRVKKIKNEDRLYYFDSMTNLKNRNYLNDNIDFWNSSKVYPQTVIVIDINKLKELNDRKGHTIGDNQIKAVASALIKTQRDNSEIMRTDGDEFMVYLVGYEDKQISSYIHKLNKELNSSLPDKDYGVTIGYSNIKDELTSMDDAISEALVMIKKSKGKE